MHKAMPAPNLKERCVFKQQLCSNEFVLQKLKKIIQSAKSVKIYGFEQLGPKKSVQFVQIDEMDQASNYVENPVLLDYIIDIEQTVEDIEVAEKVKPESLKMSKSGLKIFTAIHPNFGTQ